MAENPNKTLVINNFHGSMTPYRDGDINSGKAFVTEVSGYDPFTKPGELTWNESSTQIDVAGAIITDLILAGKTRVESGIIYAYLVGHTGRVYKVQVNDPTTYNYNYDNPVLLTTLTSGTPTFTRGAFIDFYGTTERIYISHDKGLTQLNFDGTNETVVGLLASWKQNVPKPIQQYLGKMYVGNGSNIAEMDSTLTITSYTKLSPGFPSNTQVRDIKMSPDGTYLQMAVAEFALGDITSTTPNTSILNPSNSFVFKWSGTDIGYTSFVTYGGITITSLLAFGNQQYAFGYDVLSGGIFNPIDKMVTSSPLSAFGESPLPNAVISISNMPFWAAPLPYAGDMTFSTSMFGTISNYEIEPGYWAPLFQYASGNETDVIRTPFMLVVSNFAQGASSNGYTDAIFGVSKIYFSTLETSASPTTKYKLYKWCPFPTGLGTLPIADENVYQTQSQSFSKRIKVSEIRIYGEPWVANNAFLIDIIGSDGNPVSGGSMTFIAGTNLTIGDDFAWYNPATKPLYSMGIRITNKGTVNHTISRVEIDYSSGGK